MHTKGEKLIKEAIDIINKCGSVNYAREFARKLAENAWKQAEPLLKESEAKKKIKELFDFAIERKI